MSITSEADWKGLCEVGRIVRLALDALERHAQAGVSTAELDQVARQIFANHGARSAPAMVYGFPGTVLICVNDEVVHGVPGSRRLKPGDVVKLDVTAEKGGYMATLRERFLWAMLRRVLSGSWIVFTRLSSRGSKWLTPVTV